MNCMLTPANTLKLNNFTFNTCQRFSHIGFDIQKATLGDNSDAEFSEFICLQLSSLDNRGDL